jgi:hypothetical protein
MTITDFDRKLAKLQGTAVTTTVGTLDIYVEGLTGVDSNAGTQTEPLATISAAYDLIPSAVTERVIIHLGPHAGSGYSIPTLRNHTLTSNIWVVGDMFTELYTGTAISGSGDSVIVDSVGGFSADQYLGKTIEVLTGNAAGDRRTIKINDSTDLTTLEEFTTTIAAGDTYRIVEPAVYLEEAVNQELVLSINNAGQQAIDEDGGPYLAFVNIRFNFTDQVGDYNFVIKRSSVAFYGCETVGDGLAHNGDNVSSYFSGMDSLATGLTSAAQAPFRDLGVASITSWRGWGFSWLSVEMDSSYQTEARHVGYYVYGDAGHIIRSGNVRVHGCRVRSEIQILNHFNQDPCRVFFVAAAANKAICDGPVTIKGQGTVASVSQMEITSGNEIGLTVENGAQVIVAGLTITTTGGATGIFCLWGGVVSFISTFLSITTSGDETEVEDTEGVNLTRAVSAYTSVGDYIEAGGARIQRTFF